VAARPRARTERPSLGARLLAVVAAFYIRLVAGTTRWTEVGREGWDALAAEPAGFLLVTWHGRLFLAPTYRPAGKRVVAMVSQSRDGEFFAEVIGRWEIETVRGSSHDRAKRRPKGGSEAYLAARRELTENGALVAITPDGPRGPPRSLQAGAARLALEAGVPVVAVAFSSRWGRTLGSWDRFLLPFPFGRGAVVYGAPRWPPEERGAEAVAEFRQALEDDLNAVTDRADALCGRARAELAEAV
jgi:lysophospholipid acyltransferase (LPLAT)-like uncharacterized protein